MCSAVLVPLTRGLFAKVDPADAERVTAIKWCAHPRRTKGSDDVTYVAVHNQYLGNGKQKMIYMHRFILGLPDGEDVDHKNHDTLDNRRGNLRACSESQNGANRRRPKSNTTGYKGVVAVTDPRYRPGTFRAQIKYLGKAINIGRYPSAEEAARAYDTKAIELFGEFAFPNFPR